MQTVDVIWLSLHEGIDARGPWDTGILEQLFADELWSTGFLFVDHVTDHVPDGIDKAIVVLPARHHADDIATLNYELGKLSAVVLMLAGDEEAVFPWRELQHPNMRFWIQLPHPVRHADLGGTATFYGDGYHVTTDLRLKDAPIGQRDIPWSFSGQVTNARRLQAVNGLTQALRQHPTAVMNRTEGFTLGMPRQEYLGMLRRTKVAPCPGGPFTADTFRLFEALEAGCIPLADNAAADGTSGYWNLMSLMSGCPPFPIIEDWSTIDGVIELALAEWPQLANRSTAWWTESKATLAARLVEDLSANGFIPELPPMVVVTSSPTNHPDPVGMLIETLDSAPGGWPAVVLFDGVRAEQAHLAEAYQANMREAMDVLVTRPGMAFVVHQHHRHQATMVRYILDAGTLPPHSTMLFLEHDTPLVRDEPVDFEGCEALVRAGHFDVIRFAHEAHVHPEHEHLMYGPESDWDGVPLRRTRQWSQRPHLASTSYYRRILHDHFPPSALTMIEDKMHSVCQVEPYDRNRLAIYHPSGGNIKRSYHLDGRGDQPKFDMRFE